LRGTVTAILTASLISAAAGCGGDSEQKSEVTLPAGCQEVEAPEPKRVELAPPGGEVGGPLSAEVATNCGSFAIELAAESSPKTVSSFVHLVEEGLYDGTAIHRIEPGFVIQGGDPLGDGTGGPGYFVDEAPPPHLSYTRGVVAMAKTEVEPPGRSGSQFFVVTAADAGLSPDFALLGRIRGGFDAIERIESLGTSSGKPRAPVVIERVTLRRG
jgi:cyclophilin family peptidyl-prolyl cis-trans isomerase